MYTRMLPLDALRARAFGPRAALVNNTEKSNPTMTSVHEHIENYFGSLNPITKKIWQEKSGLRSSYGESRWSNLGQEERDELLESHFMDQQIMNKYAHLPKDETPTVFPKMDVNCGEKIVVDFENDDGWTWRDEHSGPFSWMTRSQQDLTLDELDNLEEQMKNKTKTRGKSRSPDRETTTKKQREPNYINIDIKGGNTEAAHTADEIFQKFGIAFSFGNDDEESDKKSDLTDNDDSSYQDPLGNSQSGLMSSQQEYQNYNFVLGEDDTNSDSILSKDWMPSVDNNLHNESTTDTCTSSDLGSIDKRNSTCSSTSSHKKKKEKNKRISLTSHHSDAEVRLMDQEEGGEYLYSGQVSPVYIEDPGESSTDGRFSVTSSEYTYQEGLIQAESPSVLTGQDPHMADLLSYRRDSYYDNQVICDQPSSPTDVSNTSAADETTFADWSVELNIKEDNEKTEPAVSPVRTGFDFLDNW